jgi:hypothetical protein
VHCGNGIDIIISKKLMMSADARNINTWLFGMPRMVIILQTSPSLIDMGRELDEPRHHDTKGTTLLEELG